MSRVEQFTAGERFVVDPDSIERELAETWRAAGRSTDGTRPVTRACLWNVVVHLDFAEASNPATTDILEEMVSGLPEHLAARALVLRTLPPQDGEPELRSWISANCIVASGGGKLVCSEEVSLESRGAGRRHLAGLVRALLVPGVPTAVVFGGVPNHEEPLTKALMELSDRVVLRAGRGVEPSAFPLAESLGVGRSLTDLGWTELSDFRRSVAAVFDGAEDEVPRLERVEVQTGSDGRNDAALILGWIAHCLGAKAVESRGTDAAEVRTRAGKLQLSIAATQDTRGLSASFLGDGIHRRVRRETEGELVLERPSGTRIQRGASAGHSALLARSLLRRSEDPSYKSALHWAGELFR